MCPHNQFSTWRPEWGWKINQSMSLFSNFFSVFPLPCQENGKPVHCWQGPEHSVLTLHPSPILSLSPYNPACCHSGYTLSKHLPQSCALALLLPKPDTLHTDDPITCFSSLFRFSYSQRSFISQLIHHAQLSPQSLTLALWPLTQLDFSS